MTSNNSPTKIGIEIEFYTENRENTFNEIKERYNIQGLTNVFFQ